MYLKAFISFGSMYFRYNILYCAMLPRIPFWVIANHLTKAKITGCRDFITVHHWHRAPSHYLNFSWFIVNCIPWKKHQTHFNPKAIISIREDGFEICVCKMAVIWSRAQSVSDQIPNDEYITLCTKRTKLTVITQAHHFEIACRVNQNDLWFLRGHGFRKRLDP